MTGGASKAVAGCCALAAFAVAVVAGVAGGNAPTSILFRAMIAMIVCYPLGLTVGLICQHVIEQHIKSQGRANLAVEPSSGGPPSEQNAENAEEVGDVTVV